MLSPGEQVSRVSCGGWFATLRSWCRQGAWSTIAVPKYNIVGLEGVCIYICKWFIGIFCRNKFSNWYSKYNCAFEEIIFNVLKLKIIPIHGHAFLSACKVLLILLPGLCAILSPLIEGHNLFASLWGSENMFQPMHSLIFATVCPSLSEASGPLFHHHVWFSLATTRFDPIVISQGGGGQFRCKMVKISLPICSPQWRCPFINSTKAHPSRESLNLLCVNVMGEDWTWAGLHENQQRPWFFCLATCYLHMRW